MADAAVAVEVAAGAVQGAVAEIYALALPLCRRFSVDAWFPFRFRLVSCGALCRLLLVLSFGGGGRRLVWCLGRNVLVVVVVVVVVAVAVAVAVADEVEAETWTGTGTGARLLVVVCFAGE